ncbi:MAG: DUF512 domain-containing protein, partial [Raoultibacter sp.]
MAMTCEHEAPSALIKAVSEESPADDAGFYSGCRIHAVNGKPVRDSIDWRWLTAEDEIELTYTDAEGDTGTVLLEREPGEDWGIEFEGAIFDKIKLCRNACTFCFMRQLPDDVRPSLVLRDDDFRLSFLQGTFVTLTNLSADDEARIIEQHISPLRVSLHAVSEDVRLGLIGKHAAHGFAAAERLLQAGIEMHMQIVLVPGVNDGDELTRTLTWAWQHPLVVNIGIVPVGYTKHQSAFEKSFNEVSAARGVIACIEPLQKRALQERGTPWVFAADEFYRNAYPQDLLSHIPPTSQYGDFAMFEDGIGIIRSFVDDWYQSKDAEKRLAQALERTGKTVAYIVGYAQREFIIPLVAQSSLADRFIVLPVKNEYFGGNVDVTGLLTGSDIIRELQGCYDYDLVAIPSVIFNADGLTLDDMSLRKLQSEVDVPLAVVSCNASEYFEEIT